MDHPIKTSFTLNPNKQEQNFDYYRTAVREGTGIGRGGIQSLQSTDSVIENPLSKHVYYRLRDRKPSL